MTINIYKVLSLLLEYPKQELIDGLDEMERRVSPCEGISVAEQLAIRQLISYLRDGDLTELQASYVKTFDLTPEHSLHLTHHLFGDDNDRNRGPALIDLGELYKDYGVQVSTNELPDYLPLVLEFAAMLDESEATTFLADAHKVLAVLADNLAKAASPYAPLLYIIKERATLIRLKSHSVPACLAA